MKGTILTLLLTFIVTPALADNFHVVNNYRVPIIAKLWADTGAISTDFLYFNQDRLGWVSWDNATFTVKFFTPDNKLICAEILVQKGSGLISCGAYGALPICYCRYYLPSSGFAAELVYPNTDSTGS